MGVALIRSDAGWQSILLDICIMLGGLIIQYMPFELSLSWFGTLANALTFTTGTCAVPSPSRALQNIRYDPFLCS